MKVDNFFAERWRQFEGWALTKIPTKYLDWLAAHLTIIRVVSFVAFLALTFKLMVIGYYDSDTWWIVISFVLLLAVALAWQFGRAWVVAKEAADADRAGESDAE